MANYPILRCHNYYHPVRHTCTCDKIMCVCVCRVMSAGAVCHEARHSVLVVELRMEELCRQEHKRHVIPPLPLLHTEAQLRTRSVMVHSLVNSSAEDGTCICQHKCHSTRQPWSLGQLTGLCFLLLCSVCVCTTRDGGGRGTVSVRSAALNTWRSPLMGNL